MSIADSTLDRLASVISNMARTQRDSMDKLTDHFSDRTVFLSTESTSEYKKRERMRQKELEVAKKGVESTVRLSNAIDDLESGMRKGGIAQIKATESVVSSLEDLMENTTTLSQAQQNEVVRLSRMAKSGANMSSEMSNMTNLMREVGKQEKQNYDRNALIVKHSDKYTRAVNEAKDSIVEWTKQVTSAKSSLGLLVVGIKQAFGQIEKSLEHQVPTMDLLGSNFTSLAKTAAMYGISTDRLMDIQNTYSHMFLASGRNINSFSDATLQYLEQFKKNRDALYQLTGDYNKASDLMSNSMDLMATAGVRQSFEEMSNVLNQGVYTGLYELATLTKLSAQELVNLNKTLLQDRDIRTTMIALDKNQRVNRVNEMLQYQKLLVSRGMEIEQAIEATKALERLTASIDPRDRYKQAARMRAIAGAMGVSGGEDMMRLAMKPSGQWSNQEKNQAQQFATNFDSALSKMLGSGNIGMQMVGGRFQEVVSGSLYEAMVKTQSTAGLEGRAITDEAMRDLFNEQNTQLSGMQQGIQAVKEVLEKIGAWGSDAGIKIAGGTLMLIATGIGKIVFDVAAIRNLMLAKTVVPGGAAPPGGPKSPGGGVLSKAGRALKWGLRGAGAVGGSFAAGYGFGTLVDNAPKLFGGQRIGTYIGDAVDWMRGTGYDPNDHLKMSPTKKPSYAYPMDREITPKQLRSYLADTAKEQSDHLKKINESSNPEMRTLSEELKLNTKAVEMMADSVKKAVEINKASVEAAKQNTKATAENTEATAKKQTRQYVYRSPGRDNRTVVPNI